jgi:hypothetical protein
MKQSSLESYVESSSDRTKTKPPSCQNNQFMQQSAESNFLSFTTTPVGIFWRGMNKKNVQRCRF